MTTHRPPRIDPRIDPRTDRRDTTSRETTVVLLNGTSMQAHGEPPKAIVEFVGAASNDVGDISVALMRSPARWTEPEQTAAFEEITVVVEGTVLVHADGTTTTAQAGQAVVAHAHTTVRYETPGAATYIAICRPAFRPTLVVRHDVAGGTNDDR